MSETTQAERVFEYNGTTLADPGAHMTVEQVRDVYAGAYPDIATAKVEGPESRNGKMVYRFARAIAAKG